MRTALKPVTWISQTLEDESRRKAEDGIEQVVIIDDIPRPADFRLSPEEYKRLYEERLRNGGQMPATPDEYREAYTAGTESRLFSISWLSGSIDPRPQQEDREPVVIIEERLAATLELDPEEYRRIKEELEKEREATSGFYHEPEHFYSIGEDATAPTPTGSDTGD